MDIAGPALNVVVTLMRKGGAGKTTLILLLADALARFGLSVLVVDMDPQGNASIGLGREVRLIETGRTRIGNKPIMTPVANTISEVIDSGAEGPGGADYAIAPASDNWTYEPGEPFTRGGPLFRGRPGIVGVVPAYKKLETDAHGWAQGDLEHLRIALLEPEDGGTAPHRRWDVVLIDTPPGGSLISVHAAKAAHHALFVSPPAKFGAKAIPETMELVQDIRDRYYHPDLNVIGLILNEFVVNQNRKTQGNITAQLEQAHRDHVPLYDAPLWGRIPDYTVVSDAQDAEAPLSAFLALSVNRTARSVCQAAEEHAIRLLHAIGHPRAAEITAAWQGAWPQEDLSEQAAARKKQGGRHRAAK
jgi:chromosome partitioning protein